MARTPAQLFRLRRVLTGMDDIRYALRSFARRPVFAASTILSLALAIAANAAVFSVVNAALFKDIPGVTRPERLVEIARRVGNEPTDVTFAMYKRLETSSALDGLAAFALETISISADGATPASRGAMAVTSSYFRLLGVNAERGRVFTADEASFPSVANVGLISHDVWSRELGGSPDVIGKTLRVNGVPVEIIGVLPRGFAGHHTGLLVDVFLPMGAAIPGLPNPVTLTAGNGSSVELLGRLQPGTTIDAAERELAQSADAFARTIGEATEKTPYAIQVDAWGPLPAVVRGMVAAFLAALGALVLLALAMAGMNVTTILLARASERRRELAVRRALGASEGRITRQLVTEAVILFGFSGLVGVTLASWMTGLLGGIEPPVPMPGRLGADVGLDWRVALFAIGTTLGGALLFSVVPSLAASRFTISPALREGASSDTRGRARFRNVLVGAQVAATCVLLAATLILGNAFRTMRSLKPGWDARNVLITSFDLEATGASRERGLQFQRELVDRVSAIPGVEVTSIATKTQRGGRSSFGMLTAPGAAVTNGLPGIDAFVNRVSAGYLGVLRIPLKSGRDIDARDDIGAARVAIVNETLARLLFPGRDALGQTFSTTGPSPTQFRVIGVAADAELRSPGQAATPFYYVPLAQWYNAAAHLNVRVAEGRLAAVASEITRAMRELEPALPIATVRPLAEALDIYLLPQRVATWVAGLTGLFALLLAGVGIYGVTALAVTRRSREIAIRIALGATSANVARLVVRQGSRAPLIGLVLGVAVAAAFSVGVSKVVVGAVPGDPLALIGAPLGVMLVVAAAMAFPVTRVVRGSVARRLME